MRPIRPPVRHTRTSSSTAGWSCGAKITPTLDMDDVERTVGAGQRLGVALLPRHLDTLVRRELASRSVQLPGEVRGHDIGVGARRVQPVLPVPAATSRTRSPRRTSAAATSTRPSSGIQLARQRPGSRQDGAVPGLERAIGGDRVDSVDQLLAPRSRAMVCRAPTMAPARCGAAATRMHVAPCDSSRLRGALRGCVGGDRATTRTVALPFSRSRSRLVTRSDWWRMTRARR